MALKKNKGGNRKANRKAAADARARLAPLKKAVQNTEQAVSALTADLEDIERKLADPKLYDGSLNDSDATILTLKKASTTLQERIVEQEARWLENSDALEKASAAQSIKR